MREAAGGAPCSARTVAPADVLLGAAAALCTSLGYAASFQSVRPEVYALHRLVALCGLLGLFGYAQDRPDGGPPGDRRALGLSMLALGLGLANHHFLTLLLCAPVPVLLLRRPAGRAARDVLLCFGAGAIGLLLYAYLPVRAAHHPLFDWGAPSSWGRFFWTVSAKAFQKSVKPPVDDDALLLGVLVDAVSPAGAVLALCGAWLGLRLRALRRFSLFLLLVAALHVGGRAVLGFDLANPDAYGYLLPGIDALALLVCVGAAGVPEVVAQVAPAARMRLPLVQGVLGAALLCGGAAWGALGVPRAVRSGFWDLDVLCGGWLDRAPPRARLLSSHFQTVFALWYLEGVEGRRPDVEHLHPHFLAYPGYREDVLARFADDPELPGLLGEKWLRPGPFIESAGRRRTVVEYDLDTPAAVVSGLVPADVAEVLWPGAPPGAARASASAAQARRAEVEGRLDLGEPETRRNVLWRAYLHARLACLQGDRATYAAERARARRLLAGGQSPEMDEVERRCGIQ